MRTHFTARRSGGDMWSKVDCCPGCACQERESSEKLAGNEYYFAGEVIPYPEGGIDISRCPECGLVYKHIVPSLAFLTEVYERQAGNLWQEEYDFMDLRNKVVGALKSSSSFDLLDIGPSNGALLRAFHDIGGRRSGLDVIQHPGLEPSLRGEFITGLLDDLNLEWGMKPYDAVTVFDVLEHLYQPDFAFQNLCKLLNRNGLIFIETGNVGSFWPRVFGISEWWYVRRFEHHVFWSPESIEYYAAKFKFKAISVQVVRHKGWRLHSWYSRSNLSIRACLWAISPKIYAFMAKNLGKEGVQPKDCFVKDHLFVMLKKI